MRFDPDGFGIAPHHTIRYNQTDIDTAVPDCPRHCIGANAISRQCDAKYVRVGHKRDGIITFKPAPRLLTTEEKLILKAQHKLTGGRMRKGDLVGGTLINGESADGLVQLHYVYRGVPDSVVRFEHMLDKGFRDLVEPGSFELRNGTMHLAGDSPFNQKNRKTRGVWKRRAKTSPAGVPMSRTRRREAEEQQMADMIARAKARLDKAAKRRRARA